MNFTGLSFILTLFYFIVLVQTSTSSDSLDLEAEKSEFKNDCVDAGVVDEIKIETTGIRKLESALLGHIGSFLNAPHRELGRLTKYSQVIFKKDYPYRRFVSEHFGITELASAVCDTDLYWFSDMIECYKNDPNHFFVQLTYAIFFDEKFSVNARFLCQYFLRVYKNFNLDSVHLLIIPNINGNSLFVKIAYFLHKNQLFDLMIPLFLNDHNLYVRTLKAVSVSGDFGFSFYNELISNSYGNGHGDGIKNFLKLYENDKKSLDVYYMLKNILLADEGEEILSTYVDNLEGIEAKSNVIRPVIYLFFYNSIEFSCIKFYELNFDKIFKRISRIIIKASTDELINSHYSQKFQILNEFFFGPNTEKFDLVLIEKYYEFDLFTSSIFLNRKDLFSKLLNFPVFYCQLQSCPSFFISNLSLFFEFYEKYPERNHQIYFRSDLFDELMKFYILKDFDFSAPDVFCYLILELKTQHLNLNMTSNYPKSFKYYYSIYNLNSSCSAFDCVLKYYSGSNENSLLLFLQKMKSVFQGDIKVYYFSVSDEIFKMLSISETFRNNYLSKLRFGIELTMKQLMRLINNQGVPVQILKLFRIDYVTSNISCLESDSDFRNLEKLLGKSILDIVLESFEKYPRDLNEPLKVFVRVRKVLHYFLRNNARAEISKFDPRLIELFRKEAPIYSN